MAPTNVVSLSIPAPSAALVAVREELNILHTIFGAMKNGQIRAVQWPEAKATLDYLDGKITALQATADALVEAETPPAEAENAPVIPDKDAAN